MRRVYGQPRNSAVKGTAVTGSIHSCGRVRLEGYWRDSVAPREREPNRAAQALRQSKRHPDHLNSPSRLHVVWNEHVRVVPEPSRR